MVRSNRFESMHEIDCDACGKIHKARISIVSGAWAPLGDSKRSPTVSSDLVYTCPCTDKGQVTTIEIERGKHKKIKDISIDGWESTGCEDK